MLLFKESFSDNIQDHEWINRQKITHDNKNFENAIIIK